MIAVGDEDRFDVHPIESHTIHGTHRPTSIEAVEMPLENPFSHWRRRSPGGFSWGTAVPIRRGIAVGGACGEGGVWWYIW